MMAKAGGKTFERELVSACNRWYIDEGLAALAYRRWAPPRTFQEFDVVSDSEDMLLYFAVECKSVLANQGETLYWSQYFNTAGGVHQIDRETRWLALTGRQGYLAVELRGGKGSKREAYMCPWHEVKKWRRMFAIGVRFDRIRECPQIRRVGTQYEMDSDVLCLD